MHGGIMVRPNITPTNKSTPHLFPWSVEARDHDATGLHRRRHNTRGRDSRGFDRPHLQGAVDWGPCRPPRELSRERAKLASHYLRMHASDGSDCSRGRKGKRDARATDLCSNLRNCEAGVRHFRARDSKRGQHSVRHPPPQSVALAPVQRHPRKYCSNAVTWMSSLSG